MAKIYNIENTWDIILTVSSNDCPQRYRKWNPPEKHWFCKKTYRICSIDNCDYQTEEKKGIQSTQ
ncbi:MAG: hypothetical protein JRC68_02840 [Deltaproteobacteria bacterium]|nr:hypothetical protein [Deltaproteobacteria bacterium]